VPDNQVVVVDDLVRGRIEYPTSAIGDPIIMRPTGMPLYNFAVVVDDLTMDITHVLRGEGHISNTPLQVLIYQALGEPTPCFGHFGHITSDTGSKFSKRRGEGYIGFYRELGILPEAMFNYLALLAWTPGGDREILSRDEILAEFDVSRVTAAPSQFDLKKLLWVNGHHIRRMPVRQFAFACMPYLVAAGFVPAEAAEDQGWLRRVEGICALEQPRVEALGQVVEAADFFFRPAIGYTDQAARMIGRDGVREALALAHRHLSSLPDWEIGTLEAAGQALLAELALEAKALYQPIRAAVTGRVASPPLFDTLYWIGRERSLARLALAASGAELPAATADAV
jgi:glutamyl-tRNA synthetase